MHTSIIKAKKLRKVSRFLFVIVGRSVLMVMLKKSVNTNKYREYIDEAAAMLENGNYLDLLLLL